MSVVRLVNVKLEAIEALLVEPLEVTVREKANFSEVNPRNAKQCEAKRQRKAKKQASKAKQARPSKQGQASEAKQTRPSIQGEASKVKQAGKFLQCSAKSSPSK